MNRNSVLLDQDNFLVCRLGQNDRGAGSLDPIHVLPMAFFDQSQELAGMQDGLSWSVCLHVKISALCSLILPFGAVFAR
jgi:hypothetical protein